MTEDRSVLEDVFMAQTAVATRPTKKPTTINRKPQKRGWMCFVEPQAVMFLLRLNRKSAFKENHLHRLIAKHLSLKKPDPLVVEAFDGRRDEDLQQTVKYALECLCEGKVLKNTEDTTTYHRLETAVQAKLPIRSFVGA